MTDVESDPGLTDTGRGDGTNRITRHTFRRFRKLPKTDSVQEPTSHPGPDNPAGIDQSSISSPGNQVSSDPPSIGESPPAVRPKSRVKLWDSFLQKTRKIRVRTRDRAQSSKLDRRASSQPNISSVGLVLADQDIPTTVASAVNITAVEDVDDDSAVTRRGRFRQHRPSTRSSSSLNDSANEATTPDKTAMRVSFRQEEVSVDDGYRSSSFHLQSNSSSTEQAVQQDQPRGVSSKFSSTELSSSFDNAGKDADDEDEEAHKKGDMEEGDGPNADQNPRSYPVVASGQYFSHQNTPYILNINLKEGRDLVIRDSCGTSDPYVKFKVGNKVLYKSRTIQKNLNPNWNETFSINIEDVTKPLLIRVFDYDRAWNDDPMGGVDLDLTTLEVNKETDLKLSLSEKGKEEYMGYLRLTCCLSPAPDDDKEQMFRRSTRSAETTRKSKLWDGLVNIVLIQGSGLVAMDDNGLSDPYVKFRLGLEKYKSKVKNKTLNPSWLEQFDLRLYQDQNSQLEIEVFDRDARAKDDFMGRAVIDLSQFEKEKTHLIDQPLDDGAGTIKLLLTITGIMDNESANSVNCTSDRVSIFKNYGLLNSFTSLDDVGRLEVKVFRASGLQSADFGGLSDPFCVLELINDRVQTHTEYKTLNPEWSKMFTFQVKDIHSVLEVTVYDEDRNKKVEFLGKVAIPLLRIKNGERRWYALKDRKLIHKSKGAILLEMDLIFNHIKAGIRTVNPREEKYILPEQKFKISVSVLTILTLHFSHQLFVVII